MNKDFVKEATIFSSESEWLYARGIQAIMSAGFPEHKAKLSEVDSNLLKEWT